MAQGKGRLHDGASLDRAVMAAGSGTFAALEVAGCLSDHAATSGTINSEMGARCHAARSAAGRGALRVPAAPFPSAYQGVKMPEAIRDALNRMSRR